MATDKSRASSFDAFREVDKLVAKPVVGSDGAASWQDFKKEARLNERASTAPALQVKRADRLGTGFSSLQAERKHEEQVRKSAGDAEVGSGYTVFKRKHDAEEQKLKKKRRLIEDRIRPDDKEYFIPSKHFSGAKFDYVFTTRNHVTGYYWDGNDSLKKLKSGTTSREEDAGASTIDIVKVNGKNVEKIAKKKKKKVKREKTLDETVPRIVDDITNPLEMVANALQKRNAYHGLHPSVSDMMSNKWEKATDPSSGKTYYFCRATGSRQWDEPSESTTSKANVPGVSSDESLPSGWKVATDSTTGKFYYYNDAGEVRWEKPKS